MRTRSKSGAVAQSGKVRAHVLIIESRYYDAVGEELLAGALAALAAAGATHERIEVPGALEIPQALKAAVDAGCFNRRRKGAFDGVVVLGCVIRGETSHYDIVCNNANHWLMRAAMDHGVPVGNAILTVDTKKQAMARARGGVDGKGGDAVRACLALVALRRTLVDAG
ncbi:MAG: 6,7-dimethyl-8-ribityllumazine synthase [Hyphomicrobiaceae bacterium]